MANTKFGREYEKTVWNFINRNQPTSVNKIVEGTKISKPTIRKILVHFKELGEINYPDQKRGKPSWITLKKTEFKKIFTKIKKQKNVFWDNYDLPVVVITKDNQVFYGNIDEYEARTLILYNAHQWYNNKWIPIKGEGLHWWYMLLEEIDSVYTVETKNLGLENISGADVMKLWTDHTHKVLRGIRCDWDSDDKRGHSNQCEALLHEALTNVSTHIVCDSNIPKEKLSVLIKSMDTIIGNIIKKGGKIPSENY